MGDTAVKTITIADFARLVKGGSLPVVLDVRTPGEFAGVHAPGARLMPLDQLDAKVADSQDRAGDGRLYVICQSGGRSAMACGRLQAAGLGEVYSVEGGMSAWEKAGLPVVRGKSSVISLERQVRIAAGSLVLVGCVLAWLVQPWFLALSAFVGAGLVFAGVTDFCGMGILLSKMPWNRSA